MTLVEIDTAAITGGAMSYQTPVWHFPVYEKGSYFSWFGEGKLGRTAVKLGTLIVNGTVYKRNEEISGPMQLGQNEWCQIGNMAYVRAENDNPLWAFRTKRRLATGFTDGKPQMRGGVFYRSGLDYAPKVEDAADSLDYGKMKFQNCSITLINTGGWHDDASAYFGNSVRVKIETGGEIKNLLECYVKNAVIRADAVTLECGDRREKLQQKVPAKKFTLEEFPKMDPGMEGEAMQDVYGKCEWVKCACVDSQDIYEEDGKTVRQFRTFYAARKILKLELVDTRPGKNGAVKENCVWVKQTQPGKEDDEREWKAEADGEVWNPCPAVKSKMGEGFFEIETKYCMPEWEGLDVPEMYEVCACGTFWTPDETDPNNPLMKIPKGHAAPLDIIKELLSHYCGIPYEDGLWFDKEEIEAEIGGLAPVGILYDKETPVFQAIEKLQNASSYGFRFLAGYGKFTARRDDNGRPLLDRSIAFGDIADIGKAEIDMRAENYATTVDAAYSRNWLNGNAKHCTGKANYDEMMFRHGIEKTHEPETFLVDEKDAWEKTERLERFFSKPRAMIKNLELLGWPDLRVYDMVKIDLRIPLESGGAPGQAAVLCGVGGSEIAAFGAWPAERASLDLSVEEPQFRSFGGELTCKVMGVNLDALTMANTVTLLEAENAG